MSSLLLLWAATPSPSPSGFGPPADQTGDAGQGAGLYAFLLVLGLIVVSVGIFVAMSRSLRTARRNLGGSVLPRRESDELPVTPEPARDPEAGEPSESTGPTGPPG